MRMTLLTSAAVLGLALSLPAFAQTATDPNPSANAGAMGATTNAAPEGNSAAPPASGGSDTDQSTPTAMSHPHHRRLRHAGDEAADGNWAHQPGTGMSGPASTQASNIDSGDTHSTIAPHLPEPKLAMNAGPEGYLRAADRALAAHKTGAAQQALEMAETRLLDRSTAPDAASQPDLNPRIAAVTAARKALGEKNWKAARASIQEAMNTGNGGGAGNGGMATTDTTMTAPASGAPSGGMQNGMTNSGSAVGTVSPTPNPGNSSPPINPTGAGPDGTHAIGTGNGGGVLGTNTNDSAGGAK